MKKYIISFLLIFILLLVSFYINPSEKEKDEFTKIKVAEVTHSVLYAPFYVAIEKGYFNGSEASIYVFNSNEKDYLVNFAGLTKKDGSFLVSRKKIDNFTLEDLKGKKVIGGRPGDSVKDY